MASNKIKIQFEDELQASGMTVSPDDKGRLFPLWQENLDRRARMRAEAITFEDAPAASFLIRGMLLDPTLHVHRHAGEYAGDICDMGLAQQAKLLTNRRISSLELTNAYLKRIERADRRLRSFMTVDADGARKAAKRADKARSTGGTFGPLHGIPVAVKDMIAVKGLPMTAGSRLLDGRISQQDAATVAQMRAAGAVVLGTNTLLEFGAGPYLQDGPFATGVNPWDSARIPGGSSSGSAIAVAAGLCSAALGTDTAGSVRMPAAYNGIVGVKPTRGYLSLQGVVPLCWSLDTVGTLTRTVEDAALLFKVVADPDTSKSRSGARWHHALDNKWGVSIRGLRIGILRKDCVDAPDIREDVRSVFEGALKVLRSQGAQTFDVEIPEISWNDVIYTTLLSEAYSLHAASLRSSPDKFTEAFRLQLYAGGMVTADDVARAKLLQGRMTRAVLDAFNRCDVIAFPGQAAPPPPIRASSKAALTQPRSRFTRPWNITGFPVLAMPCGTSTEGLPLSIHLAGRPFDEATLFQVGGCYQRETDWHLRRPPACFAE